jgi:hypothetical protein
MPKEHSSVLAPVEDGLFQAICMCGWVSQTSFEEEVDLIRAIHAHDAVVFRQGN